MTARTYNHLTRRKVEEALDTAEDLLDKVRDVARQHQHCEPGGFHTCNLRDDLFDALGWPNGVPENGEEE